MSRITVVTACYNSRRFLRDLVTSILKQDLDDWEHILVDDGSTDDTLALLEQLSGTDPRIKILRQENSGTCQARNRGARSASPDSEYLIFVDHDDMLEPNALSMLSEYLDAHREVAVVGCQFQEIDNEGTMVGGKTRSRWVPSLFNIPRPLKPTEPETPFATFYCGTGQGPFAMFRRTVFEQVGGWTTDFWPHEDSDLFCKIALIGSVHYLPQRLYLKRVHSGNALNDYTRTMRAYDAFRQKWDNFQPRTSREAELLREARTFYRSSFRPLRDLKVGMKAFGEFIQRPNLGKLRWALHLFGSGLRDLARYRFAR